jgi:hypothetical protein
MFRLGFLLLAAAGAFAADLRLAIIGTDTSHATAFTRILNDATAADRIPGARVVAAFKGGSADIESSANRVEGYAQELREKWGVEIVSSIADLCGKADAILLESVDGRTHLPQFREAVKCGKPMFIDKPLASTLEDAKEIARLAGEKNVRWFSSSTLRFAEYAQSMRRPEVTGAVSWGPGPFEKTHQLDLSWYAVHPIEVLFTILGTGCEEVTRTSGANEDVITGRWRDGRVGTVRALRPYGEFGAVAFTAKGVLQSPAKPAYSYVPLVKAIVAFFGGAPAPVSNKETLEMFAFMDAAQRSLQAGGQPMKLR